MCVLLPPLFRGTFSVAVPQHSFWKCLKSNLTPKPLFFQLKIEAKKYLVVFLIDSGLNLDILGQIK